MKEPVLPKIGQNWHDVKIGGMCAQCTLHRSFVQFFVCFYLYNVDIKKCTFYILDKYLTGIEKAYKICRNTRTNSFFDV